MNATNSSTLGALQKLRRHNVMACLSNTYSTCVVNVALKSVRESPPCIPILCQKPTGLPSRDKTHLENVTEENLKLTQR